MKTLALLLITLSLWGNINAQTSGKITRPAASVAGRAVLDPNGDGFSSATTAGFGTSDVATSELPYKAIPAYPAETYGDLSRGPSHGFSDIVPDNGDDGIYGYFNGSALLFRFRLGGIMPGSKAYSLLIDTDGKFGSSGPNADPNFQATTTGTNGNPGFEIEITLETNFRLSVYNVDGTSSPVLVTSYTNWQDYSQISLAATSDNGDPDFFMDFYVPFSVLQAAPFNLTSSTPLRLSASTVMAPKAAIGGPKSDAYGTTSGDYEDYIDEQPPITLDDLGSGGSGVAPPCTAPPVLNSPISSGVVAITGSWTKSALTTSTATATITVYKNGVVLGTVPGVTSGSTWTLSGVTTASGDLITAKAQVAGQSMCLVSNTVSAVPCTNRPVQPTGVCGDRKGFSGNNYPAGAIITIYHLTATGQTIIASGALGTAGFASDGLGGWTLSGGCSAGSGNYAGGTYAVTFTQPSGCESRVTTVCVTNNITGFSTATTATPTITGPVYGNAKSISGTAPAGTLVRVYLDGILLATPTLVGTSWSYTLTYQLIVGQVLSVIAQQPDDNANKIFYCASAAATATVNCFTLPPRMNVDANDQLIAGLPVTGTSVEPAGTVINLYQTGSGTPVATMTLAADGNWTSSPYVAVAGLTYYVNAQFGSCASSQASAASTAATPTTPSRCGSIDGPVVPGATSISGTLASAVAGTVVNLYQDGVLIGSATTGTTTWGPIPVNTTINNRIYANGVLTIGIQESGRAEVRCSASQTINCTPTPVAPSITPTNSTIARNQTVTYTISNAVAGIFYGLADASNGQSLSDGAWAVTNGSLSITTYPLTKLQTYNVMLKASSVSTADMCISLPAAAIINVSGTLPARFLSIEAQRKDGGVQVSWKVSGERSVSHYEVERSVDGQRFNPAARTPFAPTSSATNNYRLTDAEAPAGKLFYRVREVDLDGRSQVSSIAVVQGLAARGWLAPNPTRSVVTLELTSDVTVNGRVQITDAGGRVVRTKSVVLQKGMNRIQLDGLQVLARGRYSVRLLTPKGVQEYALVLQ